MTCTNKDTVDWTVLELPGVAEIAERVSARVSRRLVGVAEYDDVLQEARLNLAVRPIVVRAYLAEGRLGGLHHDLLRDLENRFATPARRALRSVSYEQMLEGADG